MQNVDELHVTGTGTAQERLLVIWRILHRYKMLKLKKYF
jgi:hypothetical protein